MKLFFSESDIDGAIRVGFWAIVIEGLARATMQCREKPVRVCTKTTNKTATAPADEKGKVRKQEGSRLESKVCWDISE